jgi:DNA-binding transcriptional MerR regulator
MSRTIKEAEELTKVTSQNIRYYEKQGLLAPKRDKENSYRLYSEEEPLKAYTFVSQAGDAHRRNPPDV